MRFSTEDGDDIDVYVEFDELRDDAVEQPEFDQLTVSIRDNGIEGRIQSTTNDETIADLGRSDRPVRIEAESADGTESTSLEARVEHPSGQLEITQIE